MKSGNSINTVEMNHDLKNYFNFLTDTLGVKALYNFEFSEMKESVAVATSQNTSVRSVKYLFLVENLSLLSETEKQLLMKMISALQLSHSDYIVNDVSSTEAVKFEHQIIFKLNPQLIYETYSPQILIDRPELKRKTWEDMKRILQK